MVVVVARKDLGKKATVQYRFLKSQYGDKPNSEYTKRENSLNYYQK
jgi:hypothetical protein